MKPTVNINIEFKLVKKQTSIGSKIDVQTLVGHALKHRSRVQKA